MNSADLSARRYHQAMKDDGYVYPPDCVCPIVHDMLTMWAPIPEEPNYARHVRHAKRRQHVKPLKETKAKR